MKFAAIMLTITCLLVGGGIADTAQAGHWIGGGVHFLNTQGDIKNAPGFDENSIGLMASYQYSLPMNLFSVEADLEYISDFGGSDKYLLQPQVWFKLGGLFYGSFGMGMGYIDGGWQDNPFYGLRAGTDLALGGVNLDLFATYRFQSSETLQGFPGEDLDALTFGAIFRVGR